MKVVFPPEDWDCFVVVVHTMHIFNVLFVAIL